MGTLLNVPIVLFKMVLLFVEFFYNDIIVQLYFN